MKYTLRALLAISLLVGFYLVAVGIAVGLIAAVVALAEVGFTSVALIKLGFVVALIAAAIFRGLFGRRKDRNADPGGMLVTEDQQPALWAEVRTLADEVGTRVPDEIRLISQVNAAVSENARMLGLLPGTRRLFLGVPLLLGMNRGQVRSVLAHELGHYSGKHTALGPITYRGKEAIGRVLTLLGPGSFAGAALAQYAKLYYAVSHTVSRRQELEADQLSVRVAGSDAAASALRELAPLGAAWDHFAATYARMGSDRGRRPADLFIGFSAVLGQPAVVERMAVLRAELPEPEHSIYDTHPPLRLRIEAIQQMTAGPGRPDTAPALSLLTDPARTLASYEDRLFDGSGRTPERWEVLLPTASYDTAREAAKHLAAYPELAGEARTLDALADQLGQGTEQERAFAADLIADVLAYTLVRADVAAFQLSWTGTVPLRLGDGRELDPWTAAREAAAHQDPHAFRSWAAAHGVDLRAPLELPLPSTEVVKAREAITPETDQVIGVLAPVRHRGGRALIVTRAGLMMPPVGMGTRVLHAAQGYVGRGRSMAARTAATPIPQLVARPGTLGWPWGQVASLQLTQRTLRSSFADLTLTDGQQIRITYDRQSAGHGESWTAAARILGPRFSVR